MRVNIGQIHCAAYDVKAYMYLGIAFQVRADMLYLSKLFTDYVHVMHAGFLIGNGLNLSTYSVTLTFIQGHRKHKFYHWSLKFAFSC